MRPLSGSDPLPRRDMESDGAACWWYFSRTRRQNHLFWPVTRHDRLACTENLILADKHRHTILVPPFRTDLALNRIFGQESPK